MFEFLGVDYEDVHYNPSDRQGWLDVKFTLGLDYPNLPYLIDGDTRISETVAIMKYVARKWGCHLLGSNAAEYGKLEMLAEFVGVLKKESTIPCYASDDRAAIVEACRPILAKILEVKGENDFLVSSQISWLDFMFFENLDLLDFISEGALYQEFPGAKEYFDRCASIEKIAAYWAQDRCLKAPFNGPSAKINNV